MGRFFRTSRRLATAVVDADADADVVVVVPAPPPAAVFTPVVGRA